MRCRTVVVATLVGLFAVLGPTTVAALGSSVDDPLFPYQWALSGAVASIRAPLAWCASTGAGVIVADVDTGASFAHPDLAGKLIPGAQYLGGSQPYPGPPTAAPGDPRAVSDGNGHGTMTAGIVAADTNDARGIAAVAPDARILVVKVLDDRGRGYDSDVANGIRWAVDHGANVVNVSIGPDVVLGIGVATQLTSDIPDAVHYAAQHGVAVAIAAGNSELPLSSYQGVRQDAVVVGALDPDGSVAPYSNYGSQVSLYAPGGTGTTSSDQATQLSQNVVSTTIPVGGNPDAYATAAGTSFATPHVAGTLALLLARGLTAVLAEQRLLATAAVRHGVPELDAAAALGVGQPCSVAAAPSGPPPPLAPTVAAAPGGAGSPARPTAAAPGSSGVATPGPPLPGASPPGPMAAAASPGASAPPSTPRAPSGAASRGAAGGGVAWPLVGVAGLVAAAAALAWRRLRA